MAKAENGGNAPQRFRVLNRDGTFNIDQRGLSRIRPRDLYHSLLSISGIKLLFFIGLNYLLVNLLFGSAFFFLAQDSLEGLRRDTSITAFWDCFFFSVQTLATIGYGRISPIGVAAHILVTFEALVGVLGLALTTGLVFSRFSRPSSKVLFSSKGVISAIDGVPHFIFRVANERRNQIVDAEMSVVLSIMEITREGDQYRNFYDLKLERHRTPLFALTWTAVHPIDSESPLHGKVREDLNRLEAEVIVSLTGIDDTFSQPIHARYSYTPDDIFFNSAFVDILSRSPDGKMRADLTRIDEVRSL